jgi:hypothetical protein
MSLIKARPVSRKGELLTAVRRGDEWNNYDIASNSIRGAQLIAK